MTEQESALATAPSHPRSLIYLGTPEMAVPPLRALHEAGFEIPLVITRIDKRRGRGSATSPSPVKVAAIDLGLPVSHDLGAAAEVDADLGVVVAYGRIIPMTVLSQVPMVNIHFSLLPRWRGAAPVERAILAGDQTTGVCLMEVAEGLDTGAVYARREITIGDDGLDDLRVRLVALGSEMLVEELSGGLSAPIPQEGEPSHAAKITADELRLAFAQPAAVLGRVVRIGRAWCQFRGKRLKVLHATVSEAPDAPEATNAAAPGTMDGVMVATGSGVLELVQVQPEGKKPMAARDWVNGIQPQAGERLE